MSKRHQSSRRRAYGRRQHEVRERQERRPLPERMDVMPETFEAAPRLEDHGLFGFRVGSHRLGFALGD